MTTNMKKFALVIVLLLLVSIPIGVYIITQPQEIRSKAVAQTRLHIQPSVGSYEVGDTISVDVNVETGNNEITGAELAITYDPRVLTTVAGSVALGNFWSQSEVNIFQRSGLVNPQVEVVDEQSESGGVITFSYETISNNSAKKGSGTLARITFTATGVGTGRVDFDSLRTKIPAKLEYGMHGALIDGGVDGASYAVASAQNTPTPTVTPPADRSPTPTPTGSDDDTGQPTSTPTPTPTQALFDGGTGGSDQAGSYRVLAVTSPANGTVVTSARPTFRGTAKPGSTIDIIINSATITGRVLADPSGNWSFTPPVDLAEGTHTIQISEESTDGIMRTYASTFLVGTTAPVSGNSSSLLLFMILAVLCLVAGLVLKRQGRY